MSSSASDPLSEIPQELKDLFSWSPPPLEPYTDETKTKKSKYTRKPAFYDRHFSNTLKLLQVKRLPSLTRDIAANVDKTITDYFSDGFRFPSSDMLFSAPRMEFITENNGLVMADEKAVAEFYKRITATFCLPVASTLALRSSNWKSLLLWTVSNIGCNYAIADGFLKVANEKVLALRETHLKVVLGEETFKLLQDLSKSQESLATYEFKSFAAGGVDVMEEIPKLSKSPVFEWTSCDNCGSTLNQKKHQKERNKIANVAEAQGPDALITPWNLGSSPISPSDAHPSTGSSSVQGPSKDVRTSKAVKRKRDESGASSMLSTLGMLLMTSQASSSSLAPEASTVSEIPTMGREPRKSSRLAATKRKLNDPSNVCSFVCSVIMMAHDKTMKVTKSTDQMPPPPVPVVRGGEGKGKGKAVEKGNVQGGDEDNDGDDSTYHCPIEVSAQSIVQQAWAQATQEDCSIIVIQSGNHEILGIRHRATQTLYISDIIEPHACKEPSYGKIHVGIYIAAIKDALDRKRQQADARPPGGGNGPSGSGGDKQDGPSGGGPGRGHRGDRGGGRKGDHKNKKGGSKKSKEAQYQSGNIHKMVIAAHKLSTPKLASRRDVILLYLQYGIYDSSAPSIFVRSGPTGHPAPLPSRETVQNYQLEQCLTIVLKSEIGDGATGQVLRGTLEVEASECASLDVAVKLALGSEQCEALRNECKIYHRLRSKGVTTGIMTPLGLFDDVEGGACILIMPYVGDPLGATPGLVLPILYREAALATLAEIHHANILHDDLRLDNILVADSGLTIIDFSHSRVCVNQEAKKKEYLQLRTLLDSTLLFKN